MPTLSKVSVIVPAGKYAAAAEIFAYPLTVAETIEVTACLLVPGREPLRAAVKIIATAPYRVGRNGVAFVFRPASDALMHLRTFTLS